MSLLLASATLNVLMWNSWAADLERDLSRIREGPACFRNELLL